MRTTILFAAALILTTTLWAQSSTPTDQTPLSDTSQPWKLFIFASGDPDATPTINETIKAGYLPVGMDVVPGESLSVLFYKSDLQIKRWIIKDYTDWNTLERDVTATIRSGFVPMDIGRYEEALAILWIDADMTLDGWRLTTSPNTRADRNRTINSFVNQGYTLWGLSVNDDLCWYLFLNIPGLPHESAVEAYGKDTQALQEGIRRTVERGWQPSGFALDADQALVSYIR